MDIRKFGITIAVAILTAIFIYATADAFAGAEPEYNDCWRNRISVDGGSSVPVKGYYQGGEVNCTPPPMDIAARDACTQDKGDYFGIQGQDGCVASYECSYCNRDYNDEQEQRKLVIFYVSILLGLVFIVIGFLLPLGTIHEWVGLGFIFGGVIGLFIGTVAYWSNLERWLRPLVIALELAVVLFIVYKRMAKEPEQPEQKQTTPAKRTKH